MDVQQIMAHMSSIRKDMIILEKSEFSQLKYESEVLTYNFLPCFAVLIMYFIVMNQVWGFLLLFFIKRLQKYGTEIAQLRSKLDDELAKLKAQVSLDMNLERSRSKEAVGLHFLYTLTHST